MNNARTIIECTTAEEAGRALYLGYSVQCSEDLARQLGMDLDPPAPQPWTREEIEAALDHPYGDEDPPPPGTEYEEILRIAGTARERGLLPEDALDKDAGDKAPGRGEPALACDPSA